MRGFIHSRPNTVLLAGLIVFVVGFIVWPGCAIVPLPSRRVPIDARTSAQFKFKKAEHLTRDQMIAQLGPPDEYLPDIRVACYKVNDVTRRKVFLCLFVIPLNVDKIPACDVAFIEFDNNDWVQRAEMTTEYKYVQLKDAAHRWKNKRGK